MKLTRMKIIGIFPKEKSYVCSSCEKTILAIHLVKHPGSNCYFIMCKTCLEEA